MDEFVLNIFPAGSLDGSIITTVWVGILIFSFFNLRFGWVASGLVVPGYLVPLMLIKPWAAAVIVGESFITYSLVWFYSEVLSRFGRWNSLFGRDRFFALLLMSVLVRVVFDGWLLPYAGEYINNYFNISFDYQNNLHSFGLIIVALIANQFWKPGLSRGFMPFAVTVGLTYFVVRFGLMEYTNFTMSNVAYLYEDIAISMLASPKAYIVLVTAAYIASRMNLRYGWEFNGILVPSLLTLLWYDPAKIVTTFAESLIVLFLAKAVLMTPTFKNATIEGTRKLLLFFNISYIYKFLLAYLLLWLWPEKKITDLYGFGYLVPTLIAIKMHDTEAVVRGIRVALQTSAVSIVVASVIGFALAFMPNFLTSSPAAKQGDVLVQEESDRAGLEGFMQKEKILLYRGRRTLSFIQPNHMEMQDFSSGIKLLLESENTGDDVMFERGRVYLDRANYDVVKVDTQYLVLREKQPSKGWGLYVVNLTSADSLMIQIPAPLDEKGVMDAGVAVFMGLNARTLAVAGTSIRANVDGSSDVLKNYNTMFHIFQKSLGRRNTLQVRSYTAEKIRSLAGIRSGLESIDTPQPESMLWVKSELPQGLNLAKLKRLIGGFDVQWGNTPFMNIQRDSMRSGFAEIYLNRLDAQRALFRSLRPKVDKQVKIADQRLSGYLQEWLLTTKGALAERGSNVYKKPEIEEMLFFDEEIFTPLLRIAREEHTGKGLSEEGYDELAAASSAAVAVGYRVLIYRHRGSGEEYFVLAEPSGESAERRYWGTYVIRLGAAAGYGIQIPRPVYELNSFEYGVELFERMNASALFISGAHPFANTDGNTDLIRLENKENIFNLASQIFLRETNDAPVMLIQARAFGYREGSAPPDVDMLVSFDSGSSEAELLSHLGRGLLDILDMDRLSYLIVDGSIETAGYEVGGIPQSLYINQTINKEFSILWLSPLARKSYRQQTDNLSQHAQFRSLGIHTDEKNMPDFLGNMKTGSSSNVPKQLPDMIMKYIETQDIITLKKLIKVSPGIEISRLIDTSSKQSFLIVKQNERLILVANLFPRSGEKARNVSTARPGRQDIADYIFSRAAFLEFGGAQ
ncbi:poly-gamma-glutamate biosynthesis protein PgsC/CapC [bacterium]|nr:poly-gamma-glutamate biosynthesis protein PgsC/CapC [bacterium]